jgi:hypothetical protein
MGPAHPIADQPNQDSPVLLLSNEIRLHSSEMYQEMTAWVIHQWEKKGGDAELEMKNVLVSDSSSSSVSNTVSGDEISAVLLR